IPIALDHAVGEYFVGVVADCKSVLKNDTVKTNDYTVAPNKLNVINPQGGCFEDEWEPNSAKGLAVPLTEGLHEGLGLCNDEDWYSVLVPATNTLIVTVERSEILSLNEVNPDIDIELVGPSGELIDVSVSTGQTDTVMAFVVPAEDTYFIRVKPKKNGNLAQYTIDIAMNEPFDGIDLFAAKATASPTVTFSGGALYLDWTLVNLGSTPVGAFDVKVYFSTDEKVDDTDIAVGSISIEQFPGATATVRTDSLVLPAGIAGGTYWVGIQADADDVVVEVDESNNWVTAAPIVIDGANPCIDTEDFEPNNTLETATELDLNAPAVGVSIFEYKDLGLCPDLDDWYKVELPEGKRFKATVNYLYKNTKGFLYTQLIDASGEAILDEGKLASKSEVLLPYVWQAGTYYLRVYNPNKAGKAKPYTYTLTVSLVEPNAADVCLADQFEANNHPNQAQVVGCGLKEMTLCKKDQDFLKFDLPADGQVVLTLNNAGGKMKLLVYEKIGGAIKHTIFGNNKKTITAGAEGQTYWVQVTTTSTSGVVNSFDYTIFFDGISGVDLQVEEVSPYTGQAYQGEDELVGFFVANQCLDTVNDVNFGMYLSDDGVVDENDILVREASVGKAIVGGESLGVNEKFTVPFDTPPGKYKLIVVIDHDEQVVESNEGNNASLAPFTVQEVCVDDALEPNNHPNYPTDLMLGYYENLQVCPYDLDWYRIALLEGDQLNIKAFFANGGGDLDLRLYQDGNFTQPVLKAYKTNDGEALVYSVPADGSYYIRLNGLSGAANTYSLFVSLDSIDLCESNSCQNGGLCSEEGTGKVVCDCTDTGFEGDFCETNTDDCAADSCQNGGQCTDG
ncbi:MAG TPA: hypothetical protein EYN66_16965, partial [Myxococcales bacterium]|nr:hypothetical protein [Myxococcales bacterium]